MEVHLHPDGHVYIRNGNATLYADTKANFEADYGQSLEAIPEGRTERRYIQGVMDRIADEFTNITYTRSWAQGDDILSKVGQINAAKAVRLTPPAPTQQQLEKQAAMARLKVADIANSNSIAQLKPILADILKAFT